MPRLRLNLFCTARPGLQRTLAAWLWIAAAELAAASPIEVRTLELQTVEGPVRGLLATVDLTDPAVRVVSTTAVAEPEWPADAGVEARLTPVPDWARAVGAHLAVNANYYARPKSLPTAADIIGLSMHDGQVLSPPRVHGNLADPAVLITRDGRARVGRFGSDALAEAVIGVAGVGASSTDQTEGGLLVTDGVNTGATARVQPLARHPRTAIGTDASGGLLIIMVIDGRQPDWSVGVTLPELADLMIQAGADDAVNLDGGGSSTFYWSPPAGSDGPQDPVTNRPSDGAFRAVANALGVVITTRVDRSPAESIGSADRSGTHAGGSHAH